MEKEGLPLPGFGDTAEELARGRALRVFRYLQERAERLYVPCDNCEEKSAKKPFTRYVYDTPWDKEEREKHFCSDDCGDTYMYEEPWAYFWCDRCDREISEQHPRNGWHIQYRDYDGNTVCLRCYQDLILEYGVEEEKLRKGMIPGMFFNHGNPEALLAGYNEVPGFANFFVSDQKETDRFRKKALELIEGGRKVVIGYERLAIGGSEGYVTLLAKGGEKEPRKRGAKHVL